MSVQRFDRGELKKPVKTAEGWLRVDGFFTRAGVFNYINGDGSIRRELRLPDEVFKADALASFGMVPITDDHPPEFLTSDNAIYWSRGATGEQVVQDGDFVRGSLKIIEAGLIAKIEKGVARELSCGYTCDLEERPGVTADGQAFDVIQRNIRGNHLAIVPKGRAGPEARVRMDASSARMVSIQPEGGTSTGNSTPPADPPKPEATVPFPTRIDGISFDVGSQQAVEAIEKLEKKHADAFVSKELESKKLIAERDTMQAKLDAASEELKKKDAALAEAPKKVRAELEARVALETKARAVLGSKVKLDGLNTREVQLVVLEKLRPEFKADASKSDAYVEARFDDALERADADRDDQANADEDAITRAHRATADSEENEDSADEDEEPAADARADSKGSKLSARERMIKYNRERWLKSQKTA